MKLPLFTAEASLYASGSNDRFIRPDPARQPMDAVIAQLGGRGFKGFSGCVSDCLDLHPTWTKAQCARTCRDPFAGVDLSTPSNGVNDFLSGAGIDFWEAECSALVHPWACREVARVIRGQS